MRSFFLVCILVMGIFIAGCSKKESNIIFDAVIDQVNSQSILVTTANYEGFDKASVSLSEAEVDFQLKEGQSVEITILSEVRESYPVQVSAVKIVLKKNSISSEGNDLMKDANRGSEYEKITAEEAKKLIDSGKYGVILDVRTLEEYENGHIQGATLLPYDEIITKADTVISDKDEVVLVYCRSGKRSAVASEELINLGYNKVYDFGGIIDWPYEIIK